MTLRSTIFALVATLTLGAVFQAQAGSLSAPFGDSFAGLLSADGGGTQADLPITFDDPTVDPTVTDFGGVVTSLVADPDDATNTVAQTVKGTGAQLWGGTTTSTDVGLATAIPFAADAKTMSVRVWSPDAGIPVRLKVEDAADATHTAETETLTTMAGAWETLVFDFDSPATGTAAMDLSYTFDKASIFFNFGTDGATAGEKTYLWDDVAFGGTPGGGGGLSQADLPITFDDPTVDPTVTDFGGVVTSLVADPDDATNTVAQTVKGTGAQLWGGTTTSTDVGLATAIPFAADAKTMSVRVWSPDAGIPVRLKVEDAADATHTAETETLTTMAGAWETLVFDFDSPATGTAAMDLSYTFDKASIFFNFGTDGATAGEKTYLWDDVAFGGTPGGGGGLSQADLPITFDDPTVDPTVTDFGGVVTSLVADPDDATNTVAQTVKGTGAQLWGGTTTSTDVGLATAIPFAADAKTMSVRVWSPDAGIPVRLKVEDAADATHTAETETLTTMAGAWETLVFDFDSPATGTAAMDLSYTFDKASIFFNFGTDGATAGEKTYLWDDVAFGGGATGGGGIALPVTFEAMIDYEIRDFEGTATTIIEDPTDAMNTVAQTIRGAGAATFAGTVLADVSGLSAPIPFTADATTMSLTVWTPAAGTPVRLKLERVAPGGTFTEAEVRTTMDGAWETIVFDFAAPVAGAPAVNPAETYDKVVVFFDFGLGGAPEATTYFWDDLAFGGTPPPPPEPVVSLPITFEEAIDYDLRDFEGTVTTIVEDPTDATNTVAHVVRPAGAGFAAGTVIADMLGFTAPIPFADGDTKMNVRVWTPAAGTLVRLKVEKLDDPTVSVETQATTNQSGAWEILTFDFANEAPGTAAINFASTYNRAVIFFDFGVTGATEATEYYWDNLAFGEYIPPVAVEDGTLGFTLAPSVFPNPSAGAATVVFEIATASDVTVDVVDLLGRRVAVVAEGARAAGPASLDLSTAGLPAGLYVVRVRTDAGVATTRLTVVR